ncbi:hypothetical protein BDV95DRAFT_372266 [Massariosphaeria phaeospora]|uniref:Glycine zipper 2TM domain-containing protein n=1 Tax=Massariosphaeria phaeospora TaxID=100035 RepID=A0A7C8IBQ8_9PLEO|nr:hypothetical protein BDV95DRAFT_372266 [Massariosphaeria phaeospora]
MSVLAFKALSYGVDKIPDKVWHSVPGGVFKPSDSKNAKSSKQSRDSHHRSEQRHSERSARRSRRDRSLPSDYSDDTDYDDTDYDREYRRKERRGRAKSLGRSLSRSASRGGHRHRDSDMDGRYDEYGQEPARRGPEFPPPPNAEYRPYNPQDYAPPVAGSAAQVADGDHDAYDSRASSAKPEYGYAPQVNDVFRSRSATIPPGPPHTRKRPWPPILMNRSLSNQSTLPMPPRSPSLGALARGSPLQTVFTPSYEPPLAALIHRSATNPPQPLGSPPYTSSSAAKYTPAGGYSAPPPNASIPPPNAGYAPYNPAEYTPPSPVNRSLGNNYPTPPPFYRQESRSQPSLAQYPRPDDQAQLAFAAPPDRHGRPKSSHRRRNGDGKHHRARSAGHHGRSRSRVTDQLRDRFDNLDMREKDLAASVGGALAGGLVGNAMGKGTLSTLAGAAIGAFGGKEMEKRYEK